MESMAPEKLLYSLTESLHFYLKLILEHFSRAKLLLKRLKAFLSFKQKIYCKR